MNTHIGPSSTAVVILNYNGASDTIACLKALYAMPDVPGRVIVVDNGSSGDSAERIVHAWEAIVGFVEQIEGEQGGNGAVSMFIHLPANNGYSSGNNAGIREALKDSSCRAVWILNNDTKPAPDALYALCACLNAHVRAGIAGSTVVLDSDADTVQCAGGASVNRFLGSTQSLREGEALHEVMRLAPEVIGDKIDCILGASMLVRREVFERVGLLPEEYFLYYEDIDFGIRTKRAGFSQVWAQQSIVLHKNGGSSGAKGRKNNPLWIDYLILRNRIYFVRKYFGWSLPVALMGYAGVALNRIWRGQMGRLLMIPHAVLDGLRGDMGLSGRAKKFRATGR